ncbi:zinc/manganese transport system ATP-binding protein [Mycetocola sp. CAN_C7]|uniref:ATP-binding cassette domain-containing protein n=1 Tax=Mycetocola sp. CAN_C7 TaxID=2787724 RepID=UPI0018C9EDA9
MPSTDTLATLRQAHAGYDARSILTGVDLAVDIGSLTVVTGPNGSGKSTLLGVLAGLHPLENGELTLAHGVRRALVPQRSATSDVLPLTVADVVGMGRWASWPTGWRRRDRRENRLIVARAIDAVGLVGLESRSLHELSGGQRQRAFVAQGLAQQADILLLDEPAAGLDADGVVLLAGCIAAERVRGAAVVLVTHDGEAGFDATQHIHVAAGLAERSDPSAARL